VNQLPPPQRPARLSIYAREALEGLQGRAVASEVVIGGGIALAHYVEYRETHDLDAWWATAPSPAALATMLEVMSEIATRHGLELRQRSWGETESLELLDDGRKVFSLQIAARDRYLDTPVATSWPPVRLESLHDNIASKMIALVERAAPRDFQDIHAVCQAHLINDEGCWACYLAKNPDHDIATAQNKILHSLERLEMRRPLEMIESATAREQARRVRGWFREVFCRRPS